MGDVWVCVWGGGTVGRRVHRTHMVYQPALGLVLRKLEPSAVMACPSVMSAMNTTPMRRTPSLSLMTPPKKGRMTLGHEYTEYSRLKLSLNAAAWSLVVTFTSVPLMHVLLDADAPSTAACMAASVAAGLSNT